MSTNRNISAKEPIRYLAERIDKADLGENVVRARLETHVVPFDALNVGGYTKISSEQDRQKKIQRDFANFLQARASLVNSAFKALCEGRNWPNEG